MIKVIDPFVEPFLIWLGGGGVAGKYTFLHRYIMVSIILNWVSLKWVPMVALYVELHVCSISWITGMS